MTGAEEGVTGSRGVGVSWGRAGQEPLGCVGGKRAAGLATGQTEGVREGQEGYPSRGFSELSCSAGLAPTWRSGRDYQSLGARLESVRASSSHSPGAMEHRSVHELMAVSVGVSLLRASVASLLRSSSQLIGRPPLSFTSPPIGSPSVAYSSRICFP